MGALFLIASLLGLASAQPTATSKARSLSLPRAIDSAGGFDAWNSATPQSAALTAMLDDSVKARTVEEALSEVGALIDVGQMLWAYMYMRALHAKDEVLYFKTLLADPEALLPVVYTPTVGEACQKFGQLPARPRGCYIALEHKGRVREVLEEYAIASAIPVVGSSVRADGSSGARYGVDAIVFSDGGRILGLGDLGAWGMGIPVGKLDLYTACAGFDPSRTIPVLLDVGISPPSGNTARLPIDTHPRYTGARRSRELSQSAAGTLVNSALHGADGLVEELMAAAADLFGQGVLMQFEDFNSNDAFPLLKAQRHRYLTYNDDIQGTAAVTVAGILGALRLRTPTASAAELRALLRTQRFLFHGSGSANLGAAQLLIDEGGVPAANVWLTNSRGLVWKDSERGEAGNFRNGEQRALAVPLNATATGDGSAAALGGLSLAGLIGAHRPHFLVGAVGVDPGCFDRAVVQAMVEANGAERPTIFALSNPRTQAEATAAQVYGWSGGRAIFGSGTSFEPVANADGRTHHPGQVNNVYCFPGISFGAVACKAATLPEALFFAAAEAVALSLTAEDMAQDRVVPHLARIRQVGLNVATGVVLKAQELGLAQRTVGADAEEVRRVLAAEMWDPLSRQSQPAANSGGAVSAA